MLWVRIPPRAALFSFLWKKELSCGLIPGLNLVNILGRSVRDSLRHMRTEVMYGAHAHRSQCSQSGSSEQAAASKRLFVTCSHADRMHSLGLSFLACTLELQATCFAGCGTSSQCQGNG